MAAITALFEPNWVHAELPALPSAPQPAESPSLAHDASASGGDSESEPAQQPQLRELPSDEPTTLFSVAATSDYIRLKNEAVREYNARNYPEARALFTKAHQMFPSARTHRGLGMVEFELKNYAKSVDHLEAALASTAKPLTPQLRAQTVDLLERARAFVGRVRIRMQPAAANVSLDGAPAEFDPNWSDPTSRLLLVNVGDHELEFRAGGFRPERRELHLLGGEETCLTIVLLSDASAREQAPRVPHEQSHRKVWLWTGVSLAVAGLATALAVALRPSKRDGGDAWTGPALTNQ